ncbi:MAG: hypothetical protein IPH50_15005 [Rhodanobacteraceae bacterium]|nr:hypothetical protein [Rhodanobacteraceae bacterium]
MTNRRFVGLSRLTAIVACIACANPAPVVAQSLAEDDRRLAEFVEQLSGDERPIAQLVGLLLNKEESAQDLAAEKLAQRSDLPDGALALLAMKVCLEGGFLAPPAFCGDKPPAEALWATDHSNEFNLSIACWFREVRANPPTEAYQTQRRNRARISRLRRGSTTIRRS